MKKVKRIMEKKADRIHGLSPVDARYDFIRREQAGLDDDPYREFLPSGYRGEDQGGRLPYIHSFKNYLWSIETGKNYLNFTGGITWPFFEKPGFLVVLGVQMPEDLEGLPGIEVLEVLSRATNREMLEAMLDTRLGYGATQDDNVLRIWHGPSNESQAQALHRFWEETRSEYLEIGTPVILVNKPSLFDRVDYYESSVQLILGYLQKDAAEEKRLTGLARFKDLEFELGNFSRGDIKGRVENFPALTALGHAVTSINPQLLQKKAWLDAITTTMRDRNT